MDLAEKLGFEHEGVEVNILPLSRKHVSVKLLQSRQNLLLSQSSHATNGFTGVVKCFMCNVAAEDQLYLDKVI